MEAVMDRDWLKERDVKRWHEKDKLFQLSQSELEGQSPDIQYQRMRYEREIEAYEFVRMLQSGMPRDRAIKESSKKADWVVANWNSIKKHPDKWDVNLVRVK